MNPLTFRAATTAEVAGRWRDGWGEIIVSIPHVYRAGDVEGSFALDSGEPVALVTWAAHGGEAEIVSLDAFVPGHAYGRAALRAAETRLVTSGISRLVLFTTNDNLGAQSIYLREGWRLVAVHLDAMDRVRAIKPGVPQIGMNDLPLRDMWEFEKRPSG